MFSAPRGLLLTLVKKMGSKQNAHHPFLIYNLLINWRLLRWQGYAPWYPLCRESPGKMLKNKKMGSKQNAHHPFLIYNQSLTINN
jgi:hypothetical protein